MQSLTLDKNIIKLNLFNFILISDSLVPYLIWEKSYLIYKT